jgi:hypothetical protein
MQQCPENLPSDHPDACDFAAAAEECEVLPDGLEGGLGPVWMDSAVSLIRKFRSMPLLQGCQ